MQDQPEQDSRGLDVQDHPKHLFFAVGRLGGIKFLLHGSVSERTAFLIPPPLITSLTNLPNPFLMVPLRARNTYMAKQRLVTTGMMMLFLRTRTFRFATCYNASLLIPHGMAWRPPFLYKKGHGTQVFANGSHPY